MSIKLRELIRAVRACKTAAEERAVISKECALIRTAIKEEQEVFRQRNVAKLLYIHMLGYPTHFGQMECVKLVAATGFPEKRVGYLGLTMLLNENTEVLTLVTNSLKNDLNNPNQYIVGLSLTAIGNLCTADMARDLAPDVENLLRSNNGYLRKKAALACIRMIQKEPDLVEHLTEKIVGLLKDRSHGVLNSGLELMIQIAEMDSRQIAAFARLVPSLVRLLRNLISMGYSPEHDIAGITDPFLQVNLLRILRLLGKHNEEASDAMNDVLAQVATNTETAKNAGNAVLYECVQTIMSVESDAGLKVLAINILGRFLLNRDNNIRYVALNTLAQVVSNDSAAVQRHRSTIVDCLKDPDISIRHRALELIYKLVNEQNVVSLCGELLNYLVVASSEQKGPLCTKILSVVERFSPSKKWRVDTLVTMLTLAGNFIDETIARYTIVFISQSEGLYAYVTHKLFHALLADTSQIGLVNVGVWCLGEYGELLTSPCVYEDFRSEAITEAEVVTMLEKLSKLHNADMHTKALVLNALVKTATRYTPNTGIRIQAIVGGYTTSMVLELQQRAVEYVQLLAAQPQGICRETLGKMPILDEAMLRKKRAEMAFTDDDTTDAPRSPRSRRANPSTQNGLTLPAPATASGSSGPDLLNLDDIFGSVPAPTPVLTAPAARPSPSATVNGVTSSLPIPSPTSTTANLLSDIFSGTASTLIPIQPGTSPGAPSAAAAVNPQPVTHFTAFEKGGLMVTFDLSKPEPANPSVTDVTAVFTNSSPFNMTQLVFQAAVPKYMRMEMLPATGSTIGANSSGNVTQVVRLTNTMHGQKNLVMRVKIHYLHGSTQVDEMAQISGFPPMY